MGIYRVKPLFQRSLQPFTSWLVHHKISPDWMTYGAVFIAVLMSICLILGRENHFLYALVALGALIRLAMNALDGQVSRALDVADTMGEVKNELGDRVADVLIFGTLCFIPEIPLLLSIPALIITFLIPYVGILSKAVTGIREYSGLMGKPDRMTAIAIGALLVAFTDWWTGFSIMLGIIIVLGLFSIWVRLEKIHDHI